MGIRSTRDRYGTAAILLHWTTALLVLALLGSGLAMERVDEAVRGNLLRGHVVAGSLVVLLTLARIAWWTLADRRPEEARGQPRLQRIAAWLVHRAFYVVILVTGASGMGMIALSGAADILFGGVAAPLPDFATYAPRGPHGLGAWLMIALVLAHVGAALYHQFILRDRLLARMGLGASPPA